MPRRRRRSRNERFSYNRAMVEFRDLAPSEGKRSAGFYARKAYGHSRANPGLYRKIYKQSGKPKRKYREQKRSGFWGWLFK